MTRVKFYKKKAKINLSTGNEKEIILCSKLLVVVSLMLFFSLIYPFFTHLLFFFFSSMCYILNCSRIVSICFLFRLSWFGWCVRKIEKGKKLGKSHQHLRMKVVKVFSLENSSISISFLVCQHRRQYTTTLEWNKSMIRA